MGAAHAQRCCIVVYKYSRPMVGPAVCEVNASAVIKVEGRLPF